MIVDSPLNYGLVVGQPRIIPNEDDSRLLLPATIQPVVGAMQQTSAQTGGAVLLQSQSIFRHFQFIVAPSTAASNVTLITLDKGLWEIECALAWQSDYAGTPAVPLSASVGLLYQLNQFPLVMDYITIGSNFRTGRYRFLLTSTGEIRFTQPATGVGQNFVSSGIINAVRVL